MYYQTFHEILIFIFLKRSPKVFIGMGEEDKTVSLSSTRTFKKSAYFPGKKTKIKLMLLRK